MELLSNKIFAEPKSLQELASFAVARHVWSSYLSYSAELIQMQLNTDHPRYSWKNLFEVENFFQKLYPGLPMSFNKSILFAAKLIDEELTRWKVNLENIISRFDDICWTAYFTIDRIKSQCTSKQFNLIDSSLCECCTRQYVDSYHANFLQQDVRKIKHVFGSYVNHAILYWHWYGRDTRSFVQHVWKYYQHYIYASPIQNVFKLVVFCEYEIGVFHYWSQMTHLEQQLLRSTIIPLMLQESDRLQFMEFNGLLPLHTFSFLWFLLSDEERLSVVQYHFVDFYRYMVYHSGGLTLVYEFLKNWSPHLGPMDYFWVLRLSIDTNNLDLFECFWKRRLADIPLDAIGHLLWTLLFDKDPECKLSAMIINDYDDERKLMVLNRLDVCIDNVQSNYLEKIEKFLNAASLLHMRVQGFPLNPRRSRNSYRKTRK